MLVCHLGGGHPSDWQVNDGKGISDPLSFIHLGECCRTFSSQWPVNMVVKPFSVSDKYNAQNSSEIQILPGIHYESEKTGPLLFLL